MKASFSLLTTRNELAHQKYNDFYNLTYRIKITKMIRTRVIIRNKEEKFDPNKKKKGIKRICV